MVMVQTMMNQTAASRSCRLVFAGKKKMRA